MNGKTLQKTLSEQSHRTWFSAVLEVLLLLCLGMAAVLIHSRLKISLNIPGKHGLIFMAIFMGLRLSSGLKYAASIASLGAGFMILMPIAGFSDPFAPIHYLLPGITLDLFSLKNRSCYNKLFFVLLISGIAYMMVSLNKILFMLFTGIPYGAFIKYSILAPVSFFLFGSTGGLIGAGIIKLFKNKN